MNNILKDTLKNINKINTDLNIISVYDKSFCKFGMVYENFKIDSLLKYIAKNNIVTDDIVYIADVPTIRDELASQINPIIESVYGGLDVQVGVCYGRNNVLNGLEFHQGSEVYIVGADMIMMLGSNADIQWPDGIYESSLIEFFYAPKGIVIELKGGCMHYAAANVYHNEGINVIVSLIKGTNTALDFKPGQNMKDKLLIAKNTWFIAHSEYEQARAAGWHIGIKGENFKIRTL